MPTDKPDTSRDGVMGDGTEEQNLGRPGNPKLRITEAEVREAFAPGEAPTRPTDILRALLAGATDMDKVRSLTAPDVTYVSLNFSDPELKRVMPWAGTSTGPEGIVQTFVDVDRYWHKRDLEEVALFGDDRYAALFGRLRYESTVLRKTVECPFCVYIEVVDGRCRHVQFMEDTFATTNSFRSGGEWRIRSNPNGEEIGV